MNELAYIEQIFLLIFTVIIILFLTGIINHYIQKILMNKLPKHYLILIANTIQYTLIIILVYQINVSYFNFNLGVFLTSLGIVSIAIAYSSQQIIQNFIAGLIISFNGLIEIDNWVEINPPSAIGKIKGISLIRGVRMRDINGRIHLIPNSLLLTTRVINYSKSGFVQVRIPLTIPSNSDYERITKIILDILIENPRILPNVSKNEEMMIFDIFKLRQIPKVDLTNFSPRILLSNIQSGTITLNITFWISEICNTDEITSDVLKKMKEKIDRENIII